MDTWRTEADLAMHQFRPRRYAAPPAQPAPPAPIEQSTTKPFRRKPTSEDRELIAFLDGELRRIVECRAVLMDDYRAALGQHSQRLLAGPQRRAPR